MISISWWGSKVIHFNYNLSRWNLFPRHSGRISFFWKGVLSCLPTLRDCIQHEISVGLHFTCWKLTWNGVYSMARFFWCSCCPRKIHVFNWLVWKNKVLSLDNLEKHQCNKLPMATCVLCHCGVETMDHLFIHCSFVRPIWDYFSILLRIPDLPNSMLNL